MRSACRVSHPLPRSRLSAALALFFPLRVGPFQQTLGAGTAQRGASVLHHHLAIDIAGLIGDQETGEVGESAMLAGAAERIAVRPALVAAFGAELSGSARGRKRAGCDGNQAHALRS